MDKKPDEIEIEEINLDVDDKYEVTLDISSSNEDFLTGITIDESREDLKNEATEEFGISSSTGEKTELFEDLKDISISDIENVDLQREKEESEENNISLSVDELDSILSEAKVEEVLGEGVETLEASEGVESYPVTQETLESESIDFSRAEEAINLEKEKLSQGEGEIVKDYGDVVFMSSEEYNKVASEKEIPEEFPPIIEEKTEEEFVSLEGEEIPAGTVISPEELGISGEKSKEFEFGEFTEITEEMVEENKLNVIESKDEESFVEAGEEIIFESSTTIGEEITGDFEEISKIGLEEIETSEAQTDIRIKEELVEEKKDLEIVDDISISKEEFEGIEGGLETTSVEEVKFSITPEEIGLEEIESEPSYKKDEEIVGIGFEEAVGRETEIFEESIETQISTPEEIASFVEESTELVGIGEETKEEMSISEKSSRIENAIEGLTEIEREGLRRVLEYLDKLLESLPEEKVKEFASSEYYDLYVKIFDKLNIK